MDNIYNPLKKGDETPVKKYRVKQDYSSPKTQESYDKGIRQGQITLIIVLVMVAISLLS